MLLVLIDADVIEHLRAAGPSWQTRVNDTLRRAGGGITQRGGWFCGRCASAAARIRLRQSSDKSDRLFACA